MTTRILLFIKHHVAWLWTAVEWLNSLLYRILHQRRMQPQIDRALAEFTLAPFDFRRIEEKDLQELRRLILRQGKKRLDYFQPHGFEMTALRRALANRAFIMFGVFNNDSPIGYFFLRCFWNRKCFVGRLIDEPFERQGIGRVMNQIMYHVAWWSEFRCMTTISKRNKAIMRSHRNNPHAFLVGELANEYLLVEFLPEDSTDRKNLMAS